MVRRVIAAQEEVDTFLLRPRDFIAERNKYGQVIFHHGNSRWTMCAILQNDHPESNKLSPTVARYLEHPLFNLCPEPDRHMNICHHNLAVYSNFVGIINSIDSEGEYKARMKRRTVETSLYFVCMEKVLT